MSTLTVFDNGQYTPQLLKIDSKKSATNLPPPNPLLVATPIEAGEFSILILLHGYLLDNSFYSQLIQHVASYGFIVIAPQLYAWTIDDAATEDIKSSAEITNWLSQGLSQYLPSKIQPKLNSVALSGHSRGGKDAFALALGKIVQTSLKFSALIGIDPVDGKDEYKQTPPKVLTYKPHSFDLKIPVLVIGSGLGEVKKNPFFRACAPKGINHKDFYNECRTPAYHFVAKDYGHMDMLDDKTEGIKWIFTCMCKDGKSREPMRRFVGGVIVAFLKAFLDGDASHLEAIKCGHEKAPVEFDEVDFRE